MISTSWVTQLTWRRTLRGVISPCRGCLIGLTDQCAPMHHFHFLLAVGGSPHAEELPAPALQARNRVH